MVQLMGLDVLNSLQKKVLQDFEGTVEEIQAAKKALNKLYAEAESYTILSIEKLVMCLNAM